MKLKLIKIALLSCTLSLPLSTVMASGIPVVDIAGNIQEMTHWLEKVKQWTDTVKHYQQQIQAYKQQLATATGIRDVANFVNQAKSLKEDLEKLRKPGQQLNDLLFGGSSGQFDHLYEKYKMFDTCNKEGSQAYKETCKKEVINKAIQLEQTDEIQKQVSKTIGEISTLSNRIAQSKDSKESQDLANAINLKSVMLNTLTSQWEMSVKQAEIREKLLKEERIKAWEEQQINAPIPQFESTRGKNNG